jgi:hypothetical protein
MLQRAHFARLPQIAGNSHTRRRFITAVFTSNREQTCVLSRVRKASSCIVSPILMGDSKGATKLTSLRLARKKSDRSLTVVANGKRELNLRLVRREDH